MYYLFSVLSSRSIRKLVRSIKNMPIIWRFCERLTTKRCLKTIYPVHSIYNRIISGVWQLEAYRQRASPIYLANRGRKIAKTFVANWRVEKIEWARSSLESTPFVHPVSDSRRVQPRRSYVFFHLHINWMKKKTVQGLSLGKEN